MVLNDIELGEILLPCRCAPPRGRDGDTIYVFQMLDTKDRLTATTNQPLATADKFACLEPVDATGIGAFIEGGAKKMDPIA